MSRFLRLRRVRRSPRVLRVPRLLVALAVLLALPALPGLPGLVSAQPYSFEQIVAGLKYPDPATRIKAIRMLKDAGYPEAAAPIGLALKDPEDQVQLEAMDAERTLFMTEPIVRKKRVGFVLEVRASNPWEAAFAAGPLALVARTVPVEVLSGLVAAIQDANPRVRIEALYTFGMLAPMGDTSSAAAIAAIKDGLGWTIEALKRGDRTLQLAAPRVAARVLKDCGAMSPSGEVVSASCATVGNALIEMINSRDAGVRRASMYAVGQLRYARAEQALSDQFSYYQQGADAAAALGGLAGIGSQASVSRFKDLLGSSDANFRRLAVEGIARSGDKSLQPDLDRLGQTERSSPVLLALHYASLRLGSSTGLEQLVASLRDPALRPQAQAYLLDVSRSTARVLAASLQDPNPQTRAMVADILGWSGDLQVIPTLENAAHDTDQRTSAAAQRAIARITLTTRTIEP